MQACGHLWAKTPTVLASMCLSLGLLLGLLLGLSGGALAAPGKADKPVAATTGNLTATGSTSESATDDIEAFLADKGLLGQIAQVRDSVSNKASELVVTALGFLGVPYKRGGNSVETGFDCSGFVRAMYQQTVGLILPRKAEQQAAVTQSIDKTELQPGDLVFFNTLRRAFSHVGIYVGDGKFIHSPRAGAEVRVEDMQKSYWSHRFDGARRVTASEATVVD